MVAVLALVWLIAEVFGQIRASMLVMWAVCLTWVVVRFRHLTDGRARQHPRPRCALAGFEFHPRLFEIRTAVLDALAESGFVWLSDFGAVDLQHDVYGLEVTAIRTEELAARIERIVARMFP